MLPKTQRIHNNSIPIVFSWFNSINSIFDFFKRQLTDHTDRKSLEREITETLIKNAKEELLKTFNK